MLFPQLTVLYEILTKQYLFENAQPTSDAFTELKM